MPNDSSSAPQPHMDFWKELEFREHAQIENDLM
jgi:hypothetical protein